MAGALRKIIGWDEAVLCHSRPSRGRPQSNSPTALAGLDALFAWGQRRAFVGDGTGSFAMKNNYFSWQKWIAIRFFLFLPQITDIFSGKNGQAHRIH